ncbi:hypothetical protein V2G26_016966 [Clonostachys chloroleuca]
MHVLIFHTCGKTPELSQRERFRKQTEPSNRVPQPSSGTESHLITYPLAMPRWDTEVHSYALTGPPG